MTDGPTITYMRCGPASTSDSLHELSPDLTNYAAWLELQFLETIANILDVTANELRQRGLPVMASELRRVAKDLGAMR